MRVGLVARSDQGGLANETHEIWRHVQPDVTLVVDMNGAGQGFDNPMKYAGGGAIVRRVGPKLDPQDFAVFAGCDVVVTCETFYNTAEHEPLDALGVPTLAVIHPELRSRRVALTEVVPTPWEQHRVPGAEVLPNPVALDRFGQPHLGERAVHFYHPSAPAMLDRNGTVLVYEAMKHVASPVLVTVRGPDFEPRRYDSAMLTSLPGRAPDYWQAYPRDADVLVMPRRYAGLSMPAQEAAALGMPLICLDVEPLRSLPFALTIPARVEQTAAMKGGTFDVHTADPVALAEAIDRLHDDPELFTELRAQALAWAQAHSWEAQLPRWHAILESAAGA